MWWRCTACGMPPHGLEFEANVGPYGVGRCPKCGSEHPTIIAGPLVAVHLLVPDRQGPILGTLGRYFVACERKRAHLAAHMLDTYSATEDVLAVSCPSCKGTAWYQERASILPEILARAEIQKRLRADCCG